MNPVTWRDSFHIKFATSAVLGTGLDRVCFTKGISQKYNLPKVSFYFGSQPTAYAVRFSKRELEFFISASKHLRTIYWREKSRLSKNGLSYR